MITQNFSAKKHSRYIRLLALSLILLIVSIIGCKPETKAQNGSSSSSVNNQGTKNILSEGLKQSSQGVSSQVLLVSGSSSKSSNSAISKPSSKASVSSFSNTSSVSLPPFTPDYKPGEENIAGNSFLNLNQFYSLAKQGDWLYFFCYNNEPFQSTENNILLYKVKVDGTGLTLLYKGHQLKYLNVVGDWIYFLEGNKKIRENYREFCNLIKIRTDGTGKQIICEPASNPSIPNFAISYTAADNFLYVEKDNIFFNHCNSFVYKNDSYITKIKTDGSGKTQLIKWLSLGDYFYVAQNVIYYIAYNSHEIKKGNFNDGSVTKFWSNLGYTREFCMYDEFMIIQHYDIISKYALYKMTPDGSNPISILSSQTNINWNILREWIYYSDEKGNLYRMKTTGEQKTKISFPFSVKGAYFYSFSDGIYILTNGAYYKILPDDSYKKICTIPKV